MIVSISKPKGPTSHDIVDAVRRITGERRVGHAGTLDPMAEGVLIIGIGRDATKQLGTIVHSDKEYIATAHLGATSDTDDAEGAVQHASDAARGTVPSRNTIAHVLEQYTGTIHQVPPKYSAIKLRGKPAHRRMRGGEDVHLEPRAVEIKEIELLDYTWPLLRIRVVCGSGTYIRALARDIGATLGVGGYLAALTRTRVGTFTLDAALTLEQFDRHWRDASAA
ncbi:MAG: tRNA pseudouridine(55) synthase TruB [bacterium]|nr:tRNA pseudouridine(55) synthase TruB [bacterium]